MSLEDQILFLFCGVGSLNGLFIAAYVLSRRPIAKSNIFLGLALAALSMRVLKSAVFYFNPEVSLRFLQLGLMACAFIGPFIFFYAASLRGSQIPEKLAWKIHLGAVVLAVLGTGLVFPYHRYPELWRSKLYDLITGGWVIYELLAVAVLWPLWKRVFQDFAALTRPELYGLCAVAGTVLISLAYLLSGYTSYLLATISMSVLLSLAILLFVLFPSEKRKYGGRTIGAAPELASELDRVMAEARLFANPDLTLAAVAKRLKQPKAVISQLLNETMGFTFTTYVNRWRVEEATKILQASPDLPLQELAPMCGFNSQSTLYAAFKKVGGTTPGEVRKQAKRAV